MPPGKPILNYNEVYYIQSRIKSHSHSLFYKWESIQRKDYQTKRQNLFGENILSCWMFNDFFGSGVSVMTNRVSRSYKRHNAICPLKLPLNSVEKIFPSKLQLVLVCIYQGPTGVHTILSHRSVAVSWGGGNTWTSRPPTYPNRLAVLL